MLQLDFRNALNLISQREITNETCRNLLATGTCVLSTLMDCLYGRELGLGVMFVADQQHPPGRPVRITGLLGDGSVRLPGVECLPRCICTTTPCAFLRSRTRPDPDTNPYGAIS